MSGGVLTGARACGWLAVSAAGAMLARALVYSFGPAHTPIGEQLAGATGRPSVTVELIACAVAVCASVAMVGTAAVAVAERRRLEPLALSASAAIEPLRRACWALGIVVGSSLVFTILESYLHWRAGLGLHGLRCLTGPVHRDALPFLAALSLLAAAAVAAAGHVLAWLRRTIARFVGRIERRPTEPPLRPRRVPILGAPARDVATALGARAPPSLLVRIGEHIPTNKEGERMHLSGSRRAAVLALSALAPLVVTQAAFAHTSISPAVAKSEAGQLFTLAVPTEEEDATTSTVELTPPEGFSIFSVAPSPGWKRDVQESGSGEEAVITKVTWSGGKVPTGELALFQFVGSPESGKTYSFNVRQTYSNEKVVDWSGPESSDTPAPTVEAESSIGGSSATLAIIALVVGALGVLIGLAALLAGRRTLA